MADPQAQPAMEDETFLTEDGLVDEYFKERHGIEPEPEQQADSAEPAPEAVEPAPETAEAPPADAQAAAPEADDEPEWMKALPDDAKEAFLSQHNELASLRQNYTAVHNRLAPVQQENARLRKQLATPQPAQENSATPAAPAAMNLDDVEEFREYKEAFPEEAKVIEAAFGRQAQTVNYLQQQLGNVSQGLQEVQQFSSAQQRSAELSRLSQAHPDWGTVRPSEDFNLWLQAQPPEIASLADSPKADHCIWILDRYKADAFLHQQMSAQQNGQTPPVPEQAIPQGNPVAQQTRNRRRQTRSVPSLPPQQDGHVGAPQHGGQMLTEEEIWDQEVRRRMEAQKANR